MSALDVIRRVETLGGRVVLQGSELRLQAANALPAEVVEAVAKEKLAIMVALGSPLDTAVTSILGELRPHLSPRLRALPDERLVVLINWSIVVAFDKAIAAVSHGRSDMGGSR